MLYLDTSYLIKLYMDEPGSQAVESWLHAQSKQVVCCLHGRLEIFSALKRHQREARMTETKLRSVLALFAQEEAAQVIRWLPISSVLMATACEHVRRMPSTQFLRAADALHLAAASDAGCKEIYSHDRHLLASASLFGLKGIDIIPRA